MIIIIINCGFAPAGNKQLNDGIRIREYCVDKLQAEQLCK